MRIETILVVLMGIIVLVAGVQAIQLNSLSNAIMSSGGIALAAGAPANTASKPGALSQLPTQVGGCG